MQQRTSHDSLIVGFDNLFYPISEGEQDVLNVLCRYVDEHSPIVAGSCFGDSSNMCELPALEDDFAAIGMTMPEVMSAVSRLETFGYVTTGTELSEMDFLVTNKGWVQWQNWDSSMYAEVAADVRGRGWDWDALWPFLTKDIKDAVDAALANRQSD